MAEYRSKYTGAEVDALLDKVESGEVGGKVTVDSALSTESENPVMNKVITAELSSLGDSVVVNTNNISSLAESKADKDGVYSGMTVGRSIDLLGVEDVEEGSFLFRPTDGDGSIKDGVAVVKSVKGDSVVWNQLYPTDWRHEEKGVLSISQGGVIQSQGTATGSYWNIKQMPSNIEGHKYLFEVSGLSSTFKGRFALHNRAINAEVSNGYAWFIYTNNDTSLGKNLGFDRMTAGDVIDETYEVRVIDLTKAFPNDWQNINTIEDFNARVATLCIEDMNAYNAGEVVNMKASAIKSVGFNAWDEEWENGTFNTTTGANVDNSQIRSKNLIKVLPDTEYHVTIPSFLGNDGMWVLFYDQQGELIEGYKGGDGAIRNNAYLVRANSGFLYTAKNAWYIKFYMPSGYGTTYNHDICINLVHSGYRNGEYEPYVEDVLALPTLDLFPNGMNKIGDVYDEYDSEKSVQRIGIRPYQSGDESIENVLTDGTSTLYVLEEPIVTPHDYRLAYKAWDFGTEQVIADGNTTAMTAGITYEFNARDTIRGNKTRLDVLEPIVAGKIDKEADDYYPQLAVGLADNLAGVDVVDSEVNFRRSGGGAISDGVARIEAIKGNSVVWNMQYKPYKSSLGTTTNNGITYTVSEDGKVKAEGTAEGGTAVLTLYRFPFLATHKYILIAFGMPAGEWGKQGLYFGDIEGLNTTSLIGKEGYKIFKPAADGLSPLSLTAWTGYSLSCEFRPIFCDLTQMFGAGNEPTTIEEFYSRIPMGVDLNAYNEGEVIHMDVQSIESQGVNAWDEEWESGHYNINTGEPMTGSYVRSKSDKPIKVLPNTEYYIHNGSAIGQTDIGYSSVIFFYDTDDNFIKRTSSIANKTFTTPQNCDHIRLYNNTEYGTTYKNDICINLSDASINGKYFPYIKRVEDLSIIRKYFPNGMKSAGTAHDEIRYNKATQKWEYSKGKIKEVDLGVANVFYSPVTATNNTAYFYVKLPDRKIQPGNVLCTKYRHKGVAATIDKNVYGTTGSPDLFIIDSAYTDIASFKAAMQGVMLYYESNDWEWVELDAEDQFKDLDYQVWNCGTEKAIAEGKSAPLAADITYGFNAIGKIKELEEAIKALQTKVASL